MATDAVPNGENYAQHLSGDDEVICPTCDVKIKRSQVADHCQMEMDRLHNPTSTGVSNPEATPGPVAASTAQTGSAGGRQPWSVFQRVQRNRQARQRQRTKKRPSSPAAPPPPTGAAAPATASVPAAAPAAPAAPPRAATPETSQLANCPVCSRNFPQTSIQEHVNQCLRNSRKNGKANGEQSSDDSEESDEYEEYEWAGQKRIRVSTLVQGGYSALGLGQTIKYNGSQQAQDDEDEDLNVDEDDTHIYGPTQYGEGDVISVTNADTDGNISEADVTSYVRRLISSSDGPKPNHSSEATEAETTATASIAKQEPACEEPSTSRSTRSASQNQQHVIESLKAKLRLYESQAQGKYKCLICLEDYKNPAISVSCWHVHCEQCWLKTLGARKLCPQCNSITTPKDLRRIYL
ncbi:hypothetical protein KR054_008441 [Drosophila jambulina]|nr:hypothetical protein KR054_008441 [Drosophila jambulina]